ncbi:MAG: PDZ domain-containing protein, partial [Patescibacteria group bacterium]
MPTLHERSKKYLYRYLVGILVLAAFGLGLFVGQGRFILRPSSTAFRGDPDLKGLWIETRESARKDVPFQLYWDIWDRVKQKYVGGEVDDLELFYGSLSGMVAGLGDPYSSFLTPSTTEAFLSDLSGSFEGIGAEIGIKDGELTVIAPLPDSPAERAGIKAGDAILEIDDKDTSDVSLDAAVNLIRGPRGTKVTLTIRRNGFETEEKLTITRATIDIKSVEWKLLDAGV